MRKLLIVSLLLLSVGAFSQTINNSNTTLIGQDLDGLSVNAITTAVPFLSIAPDSRAGGMGDAGVATSPDVHSQHWNPSKYAFIENDMGFSVSYTPWLKGLVNDINLGYVTGYYRFDKNQTVSGSLLYFSLGDITFTDNEGNTIGQGDPKEFAIDGAYSRLFSDHISGSVALRYIHSDLTNGYEFGNVDSKPGQSVAADVSAYYEKDIILSEKEAKLAFGMNISNIGAKISYTANADKDFIPTNLRLGGGLKMNLDEYNTILFTADINKLLVPTNPVYYPDSVDLDGNLIPMFGKDPNVSVPMGMIQSFYDAPGIYNSKTGNISVMKEELRELMYSVGMEYWYAKQFALRAGYFHEHATKGNRKFFTVGFGLKLNVFALDFAYLIPTRQKHPLENTLRFTISFDLENFQAQAKE
jgi:hypothetical protein